LKKEMKLIFFLKTPSDEHHQNLKAMCYDLLKREELNVNGNTPLWKNAKHPISKPGTW
jgi:hypothetical protein